MVRVKSDISDKTPGWMVSEYEMKGILVHVEIGPKDIEKKLGYFSSSRCKRKNDCFFS